MICVKTGAMIWIDQYNVAARCDAYEGKDCMIFRIVKGTVTFDKPEIVNYIVYEVGLWFDKDTNKISTLISSATRNLGYEGGKLSDSL